MFPEKDAATIFIFVFVFIILSLTDMAESSIDPSEFECSKTCVVENCNTLVMRYGKYCGVGWSGCLGEIPCDDLDACCQIHDQCVDQYGMSSIECHEECRRCVNKVEQTGKLGFSKSCPYDVAIPTLVQCMDVSIMLSQYDVSEDGEL